MSKQGSRITPMDDDVTSFPADAARLHSFEVARQALADLSVPQLVDPAQPHQKLFVAAFDGAGNRRLGQASGAPAGEAEERLCRSLLAACKDAGPRSPGITRADHVLASGEHLFIVQGRLDDPSHRRVHVHAVQAMDTSLEQSDARVQAAGLERERLFEQAQQQAREQAPVRGMSR